MLDGRSRKIGVMTDAEEMINQNMNGNAWFH